MTRVGRQTQIFIHKILSDRIRSLLAEFHELERYARFGSELSGETQLKIKRGKITEELLKQDPLTSIRHPVQILLLTLVFTGFFDKKNVDEVKSTKGKLVSVLSGTAPYNEMADNIESFALDDLVTKLTEHNQELEEKCRQ